MPRTGCNKRYLTLEECWREGERPQAVLLNGMHLPILVTERPSLDSTEDWLVNISADTHPIHLHLVQFEIERRVLDVPAIRQHSRQPVMVPAVHLCCWPKRLQATLVTPDNPEQYFPENPSGNL